MTKIQRWFCSSAKMEDATLGIKRKNWKPALKLLLVRMVYVHGYSNSEKIMVISTLCKENRWSLINREKVEEYLCECVHACVHMRVDVYVLVYVRLSGGQRMTSMSALVTLNLPF